MWTYDAHTAFILMVLAECLIELKRRNSQGRIKIVHQQCLKKVLLVVLKYMMASGVLNDVDHHYWEFHVMPDYPVVSVLIEAEQLWLEGQQFKIAIRRIRPGHASNTT